MYLRGSASAVWWRVFLEGGGHSEHGKPVKDGQLTNWHAAHQTTMCTTTFSVVRDAWTMTLGKTVPSDASSSSLLPANTQRISRQQRDHLQTKYLYHLFPVQPVSSFNQRYLSETAIISAFLLEYTTSPPAGTASFCAGSVKKCGKRGTEREQWSNNNSLILMCQSVQSETF